MLTFLFTNLRKVSSNTSLILSRQVIFSLPSIPWLNWLSSDNLTKLGSCCVTIGYTNIWYSIRNRRPVQSVTSHNSNVKLDWLTYSNSQSNLTTVFSAKYVEVFGRSIGLKILRRDALHYGNL